MSATDFVRQHLSNIDRTVDLNAPSAFDRTAVGQVRTVAAANATRPILPANGGIRQVNVLMNLGVADYNGLQTQISYRGRSKFSGSLSYTLSKATNTTEPDGNGINPNQPIITQPWRGRTWSIAARSTASRRGSACRIGFRGTSPRAP